MWLNNSDHSRGWQSNNTAPINPSTDSNRGYNYYTDYSQSYPGYAYPTQPLSRKSRAGRFLGFMFVVMAVAAAALYFIGAGQSHPAKPPVNTGLEREGSGFGFTVQPNDPLFDSQYALKNLKVADAWKITTGSPNVIVAVIDTGVDVNHPDLKGRLVKGYDFVNDDDTTEDFVGHGTFVASLIAATGDDKNGIIGLAPNVKIMPLKVLSRSGGGDSTAIAKAIRYATDNGAKVINLSLGSPYPSRLIRQATDYAIGKGVVVVAAAGNDGSRGNPVEYPASFPDVISVGATGPTDKIASFSTHNSGVNVAAPGLNVLGARSSQNTICRPVSAATDYCLSSGTSFAAPYVSATAALMLSVNSTLTPQQVLNLLERTATDLGPQGTDDYYGAGLVNVGKAVAEAKK